MLVVLVDVVFLRTTGYAMQLPPVLSHSVFFVLIIRSKFDLDGKKSGLHSRHLAA
jgi:hypothetical protein